MVPLVGVLGGMDLDLLLDGSQRVQTTEKQKLFYFIKWSSLFEFLKMKSYLNLIKMVYSNSDRVGRLNYFLENFIIFMLKVEGEKDFKGLFLYRRLKTINYTISIFGIPMKSRFLNGPKTKSRFLQQFKFFFLFS